ncbi:MAG: hypothetical protein WD646_09345 [Actinomycetota bacterium]
MGLLRIRLAGFLQMPHRIAPVIVGVGAAVVAFAVFLVFVPDTPIDPVAAPNVSLEPADPSAETPRPVDTIYVLVVDGTGEPASGVPVELLAFEEDERDYVRVNELSTDDRGRAVFDDVEVDPGHPHIAEAVFDDTRFTGGVLRAGTTRSDPVEIEVARTTRSAKELLVDVESIAIVGDARGAQALHALSVVNHGDRAYVGDIRLPVLPGGTAIQVRAGIDERRSSISDGQIVSSSPITPGRHEISYTYPVQGAATGFRVRRNVTLRTERFDLLVGGELEGRPSGELRPTGDVDVGGGDSGRTYRRYTVRDLEPGDVVAARVVAENGADPWRIALPIAAGLLAIAIVAIPIVRRRRKKETAVPQDVEPVS